MQPKLQTPAPKNLSLGASFSFSIPYFLDWISTYFLIMAGGREANPFLEGLDVYELLLLKIAVWIPLALSLYGLGKIWPRAAYRLVIGLTFWFAGITIWNVKEWWMI